MSDKLIDMIWAEQGGISLWISEGEHDTRVLEIRDGHGSKDDKVLARATIADFRRKRVVKAFDREAKPGDSQ